jgi:alkaline phosphatase D
MDGFRWDYPDKTPTPNLGRIAKSGVKAEAIIPSFPTKTFPNHYTMATGLYPDHHGIILNNFYDPYLKDDYSTGDRKAVGDGKFYGGEPIWVTAQKQGLTAASLFWVGSEAEIGGERPSRWKTYKHRMPYGDRIDTVMSWLQLPEPTRPNLILWYLDQPDSDGHDFGPDSPEVIHRIHVLDSLVGVFLDKVETLPYADQINIIVTSDHGMCPISNDRVVLLDEYLDTAWIERIHGGNPVFTIAARPGFDDEIETALKKVKHITTWRKDEIPERLHYGSNPRVLDFVVATDSSWSVFFEKAGDYLGGTHGFDNQNKDMHAIFYAAGPAFKKGYQHGTFNNVDLYGLMCEILKLKPAPNDGQLSNVLPMLN